MQDKNISFGEKSITYNLYSYTIWNLKIIYDEPIFCRGQDQRNKLCLAQVLVLPISPFKRFGLNL